MSAGLSDNGLATLMAFLTTTKAKTILVKSRVIQLRTKKMISVF